MKKMPAARCCAIALLIFSTPLFCDETPKTLDEILSDIRLVIKREVSSCQSASECRRLALESAEVEAKRQADELIAHEIDTSPYIEPGTRIDTRIISSEIIRVSDAGHADYVCSVAVRLRPMLAYSGTTVTTDCPDVPESDCYSVRGEDSEGKAAEFRIYILSNEYNWKILETTQVEQGGRPVDLSKVLEARGVRRVMETAIDIIAAGTASFEGSKLREETRAGDRADQLVSWVRQSVAFLNDPPGIYRLNLGKFMKGGSYTSPRATAYQRKVILVAVLEKDEGVALDKALWDALKDKNLDQFTIRDYSKGNRQEFDLAHKS